MSTEAAVAVDGLSKRFGDIRAVDRLSFAVAPGELFGLVGPDGAGKTTTLRILAGVLAPDAGSARVAGHDVVRHPESVKHAISYMPQRFGLYDDLTVDENIRFYADLFGIPRRERERRTARLLAICGMTPFRGRLAGALSGGMKQKLGLSCALVHRPRVLLLDEPTTGVDPVSRRDFWRLLYELLAEGMTVITSTAYLDEAERCHRLALLHRGRAILCDTPARLKAGMPGAVVAVTTPESAAARDALADLPDVTSLHVVGDGVRVVVASGAGGLAALRDRLRAAGIAVAEIAVVSPAIEDVFVASVAAAEALP